VAFLGRFFGADVVKVVGVFLQIFGLEIDTHRIESWARAKKSLFQNIFFYETIMKRI